MDKPYQKTITEAGISEAFKIYDGHYLVILEGTFAGSTAHFVWRAQNEDSWKSLQDVDGVRTFTEDWNGIIKLAGGQLAVEFTGAPTSVILEVHKA